MPTTLSQRIQTILTEKNVKKTTFAKSLGISPNYVYTILSGRRTHISETLAKLIENLYGYPAQWVLTGQTAHPDSADSLQSATLSRIKELSPEELQILFSFLESMDKD